MFQSMLDQTFYQPNQFAASRFERAGLAGPAGSFFDSLLDRVPSDRVEIRPVARQTVR